MSFEEIKLALENNDTEFIKTLLKDPDFDPSLDNNFMIRWASENGYTEIVERLLKNYKVDPSAKNNFAIRKASENGHIKIVEMLLTDPRVDPSAKDNYAVYWASNNEHFEIVKLLLNSPKMDPNFILRFASEEGYTDFVKSSLEDPRVNPSDDNNYAIRAASQFGHTDAVKVLLNDPRVDPSDDDNFAIELASENGHTKIVELLLTHPKVDPSSENNYAIRKAAKNGYIEIVEMLLKHPDVDPSDNNNYAIRKAAQNGHIKIVELLLKYPEVDPSDNNNQAIQLAAENGEVKIFELLLSDKRVRTKIIEGIPSIEKFLNLIEYWKDKWINSDVRSHIKETQKSNSDIMIGLILTYRDLFGNDHDLYEKYLKLYLKNYISDYACYKYKDYDNINVDIIEHIFLSYKKSLGPIDTTNEEEKVLKYFKENYYQFFEKLLDENILNQGFKDFLDKQREGVLKTKKDEKDKKVNYLDENFNNYELLYLAKLIANECKFLALSIKVMSNLEKIDDLYLGNLIKYHREACLFEAYNMTRDERIDFISRVWKEEFKNANNFPMIFENNKLMCSLIAISLFCNDLSNELSFVDMLMVYYNIMKGKKRIIPFENKENLCQSLKKILFEELKRKDKEKLESPAKKQRIK